MPLISDLPSLALGKRKPLKGIHGLRFANRRHTPAPTSDGLEGEQSRSQHGCESAQAESGKRSHRLHREWGTRSEGSDEGEPTLKEEVQRWRPKGKCGSQHWL